MTACLEFDQRYLKNSKGLKKKIIWTDDHSGKTIPSGNIYQLGANFKRLICRFWVWQVNM